MLGISGASLASACAFLAFPAAVVAAKGNIYGEHTPIAMTQEEQQGLVATLTVLLFILMAFDFTGPEVLFLIALMILCLAQILTLSETLSGMLEACCRNPIVSNVYRIFGIQASLTSL